jgi:hypothetical protein
LKGEVEKKNQSNKKAKQNNKINEDQTWKKNNFFYWIVKLKGKINLIKWLKNKTIKK